MEKVTLTQRINAIDYNTLTEDDFNFLKERALKSVAKHSKSSGKTKAQKEREIFLKDVADFVAETGPVTVKDLEEKFQISNQKAARALKDAPGVEKKDGKGKEKATYVYVPAENE